MDYLFDHCINKLSFNLPFIFRYVGDVITAVPANQTDEILRTFNSFNENIQFTIEMEENRAINFLDTKLIRNSEII